MTNISKVLGGIFAIVWIVSWFLSIWIHPYAGELFWTGLFSIVLAFLFLYEDEDTENKKQAEKDEKTEREKEKLI